MKQALSGILMAIATATDACDLSLLLAVDVSGSVDRQEYSIQMQGLAEALRLGVIADALVRQNAHVALMQWTGSSRQRITIPWSAMQTHDSVMAFASKVEKSPRVWGNYSTAIGDALRVGQTAFEDVAFCHRKVIDVSGDGVSNEGDAPESLRAGLVRAGITVNALAIETDQTDLTAYYFENVIAGEGAFVGTADGFEDYPAQIIRKLQREVLDRVGALTND